MPPLRPLFAAALLMLAPLSAANAEGLSADQKTEVEHVVHDYILKNPEIVLEAIQELRRRDEMAAQAQQQHALSAMVTDKDANRNDPWIGNPDGDVTMIEFFDYRCGFCKRVFDDIQTLIKDDGNIRYVLKEFPVLGPESIYASRAAMAVWLHQREKYQPFHVALMSNKGALSNAKVLDLAASVGVDVKAMSAKMKDPVIDQTFDKTRAQAEALGITGTPGFVVGNKVVPGAIPLATMKQLVAAARKR